MRALVVCLLLTGCAGSKFSYDYGPGDWLAENTSLNLVGGNLYERVWDPEIRVHVVDDLTEICGGVTQGCAIGTAETCDIYVGERASISTINHEKRHCRGWDHRPGAKKEGQVTHWYTITATANREPQLERKENARHL